MLSSDHKVLLLKALKKASDTQVLELMNILNESDSRLRLLVNSKLDKDNVGDILIKINKVKKKVDVVQELAAEKQEEVFESELLSKIEDQ